MGYTVECSSCFDVDGNETSNSIVMADREAAGGHYEELTTLIGTPFLVCNGARHGAYGDPLLASDGKDCCYVDALHESSYPAVRVEPSGVIAWSEVEGGRKYWGVYGAAVAAIKQGSRYLNKLCGLLGKTEEGNRKLILHMAQKMANRQLRNLSLPEPFRWLPGAFPREPVFVFAILRSPSPRTADASQS